MAQLNAPVSDIQLKSNMIGSGDLATMWTAEGADEKYPSAKATLDKAHPVNSVIMVHKELITGETYEVTNPTTFLKLPGKWTLIDKAFKNGTTMIGPPNFSTTVTGFSFSVENAIRNDHTLTLQLGITVGSATSVPSGQTLLKMATLNLQSYGVYGLSHNPTNNIAFAVGYNNASSAVCYSIDGSSGELSLRDVLTGGTNAHTLNGSSYIYINTTIPIPYGDMIDSFCDKFYWKRTA